MKRIKILLIIAFAVIGALLIYNHFDTEEFKTSKPNPIKEEYNLTDEDIVFQSSNIDEVIGLFNSNYAIVFMCTPDTLWCQKYTQILNKVAIEKDIDKIYYLNIKNERSLNTSKYQKLVGILSNQLYTDDAGEKRIYMPDITFIKNGSIIAHDNETSIVTSDITVDDYYTEEKIKALETKLCEYIDLLNKDEENVTTMIGVNESEE